jgi:hypothetical protein
MEKQQPGDPKNKPANAAGDDEERKKQARAEEGGDDDDEEFPDIYNEKDPDFDDPDEQEYP